MGAAGRYISDRFSLKHFEETHIQVLQTVPAEGVFAAHAQHLGAALVPLDVGAAHGALLDRQVRTAVAAEPAQNVDESRREEHVSGSTWEAKSTDTQASLFSEQRKDLYLAAEGRVSAHLELGWLFLDTKVITVVFFRPDSLAEGPS